MVVSAIANRFYILGPRKGTYSRGFNDDSLVVEFKVCRKRRVKNLHGRVENPLGDGPHVRLMSMCLRAEPLTWWLDDPLNHRDHGLMVPEKSSCTAAHPHLLQ